MKMKLLTVLALLLLLIIPGCGDDSGVTVDPAPSAVEASTVQGTVYGTDGRPVGAGITVRLTPNVTAVTGSENYGEQQTTTTDNQGCFTFTVHYRGTYFIDALDGTQVLGSQFFNITGPGQVINILLGQATGRLTVTIVPADANAVVTIEPGGDLTNSASSVTGSQTGEYIFYLAPGLYTVYAEATGYLPVDSQPVTVTEGGEYALTFDFEENGEMSLFGQGIDPYSCINTGEVPVKYYVDNFTGTGTMEFILKSTGEVIHSLSVAESDLLEGYGGSRYFAFTINTTTMPTGLYSVKITHNPPVITESSTTVEQEFYISDTIQGAIYGAADYATSNYDAFATWQEIITPRGDRSGYYTKVYIPAGNYYYANAGDFHKALPSTRIILYDNIYLQGAGRDTTILDARGNSVGWSGLISMQNLGTPTTDKVAVMEGFTIRGAGFIGIWANISACILYNNRIENNNQGIFCQGNDIVQDIFDNIITDSTTDGISLGADRCDVIIENNVITENRCGIYTHVSGGGTCLIRGNNIYKNTGGGIYMFALASGDYGIMNNVIRENSTTENGGGIHVGFSTAGCSVNIKNNEITKNTASNYSVGVSGYGGGIYYEDVPYGVVTGNNIYGNTTSANPNTGKQLYCDSGTLPLTADNNWWNVTLDDNEVFKVTDVPAGTQTVDTGTPATTQFPVPVVPAI